MHLCLFPHTDGGSTRPGDASDALEGSPEECRKWSHTRDYISGIYKVCYYVLLEKAKDQRDWKKKEMSRLHSLM